MPLTISRALQDRLVALAAAEPDREVCGLLLGEAGIVTEVRPASNLADDTARRFEIDPAALFAAIHDERSGGTAILGYFHSHPSGDGVPSAEDLRVADDDGRIWVIVAGAALTAWQRDPIGFSAVAIATG